jgi:hypothetical protein
MVFCKKYKTNLAALMKPLHRIYGKWLVAALIFSAICLQASAFQADTGQPLVVGKFSAATLQGSLPDGWQPLTFKNIKNYTHYTLVKEDGIVVIKAQSNSAASGLIRNIKIDPAKYPVVTWRWKIVNILEKGDVTQKSGDDYPARLYITFPYDPAELSFSEKIKYEAARLFYGEYPPSGAISYIWASKAPAGAVVPNPYTDRAMMIVVQSGATRLNTWIDEKRNLAEDYQKAFGRKPPVISGVAIMTDTDNTQESATAYYGDITFNPN